MRWGVIEQLRAGRKSQSRLRAVIEGVPDEIVGPKAVREALEAAGETAYYSSGGIEWANHRVVREDRWPASLVRPADDTTALRELTWEKLTGESKERVLTIPMPPAEYAWLVLEAAKAGQSLRTFARQQLLRVAS